MARQLRQLVSRTTKAARYLSTRATHNVTVSTFTTAGRKDGANQDTLLVGQPSLENLEDPRLALKRTMSEIRSRLALDERFERSGTTVTLLIKDGEKIFVRSFGDSPLSVLIEGADGKRASAQLTPNQSVASVDVKKYFSQTNEDIYGTTRVKGVAVACAGHGDLFKQVKEFSAEFSMADLPLVAKALGITDPRKVGIVVSSDGVYDSSPGEYGGNKAISNSHERKTTKVGTPYFKEIQTASELAELGFGNFEGDAAKAIVDSATDEANSPDNVTAVAIFGSKEELEKSGPFFIGVFDGNGLNGDIASEIAAQIAKENLGIQRVGDLEVIQPQRSPTMTPEKTQHSRLAIEGVSKENSQS